MFELFQDLRGGLRVVRRSRWFFFAAVTILALGLGTSTSVFVLLNALVFRDLPVRDPSRLVNLYTADRFGRWRGITVAQIQEINRYQEVFSGIYGREYPNISNVDEGDALRPVNLGFVTGDYYSVLGLNPVVGRLIVPDDVGLSTGSPSSVAVLSYEFWQSRYAGNPDVIGKLIKIDRLPYSIIGVTPKGFFGELVGFSLDVTIPITKIPGRAPGQQQSLFCQFAVGRLRDGVTFEQARASLEALWPSVRSATVPGPLNQAKRDDFLGRQLVVEHYPRNGFSYLRDQFSASLYILFGISGLILLIVCVDLSALLFARTFSRLSEMAIRSALGASPRRLFQQLTVESLVLSVPGAALGMALAYPASLWLLSLWSHLPFNPVTVLDLKPDVRVLGFSAAVAIMSGILSGLVSACYVARAAPAGVLRDSWRAPGRRSRRLGDALASLQMALSLCVLTAGALLVRNLERLRAVSPGFDSQNVAILQLRPAAGGHPSFENEYYHSLVQELSTVPGVLASSLSQMVPAAGFGDSEQVARTGPLYVSEVEADVEIVSPEFFHTLNIALLSGHDFSWQDDAQSPRVIVISRSLADRLFPSENAIGQHVRIGPEVERQNVEVVGVVSDARVRDIHEPSLFVAYVPFLQEPKLTQIWTNVELRVGGQPSGVLEASRRVIQSMGKQYVFRSGSLEQEIDNTLANEQATAMVSGFIALLALLLAATGLYSVMAFGVSSRAREFGVRLALGAELRDLVLLVLGEGVMITLIGLLFGVPIAWATMRVLSGVVPDLRSDWIPLCGSALVLAISAICAGYLPARRTTRVDPIETLRLE